jgi:sugar phosphate isomerase/epimerase
MSIYPENFRRLCGAISLGNFDPVKFRKHCRRKHELGFSAIYFSDLFFTQPSKEDHVLAESVLYQDASECICARQDEDLNAIKTIVKEEGLVIESSHFTQMLPPPDQSPEWIFPLHERLLDMAALVGLRCTTTHAGWMYGLTNPDVMGDDARSFQAGRISAPELQCAARKRYGGEEKIYDDSVVIYRRLCAEAKKRGITVTVETACNEYLELNTNAEKIVRFLAEVFADNFGVCLDSGHCHLEGVDPAKMIRDCGRHIVETHFHDNFGSRDMHNPVGIGTINWVDVINALNEIGYDGTITFEQPEDEMNAANWKAFMKVADKKKLQGK